MTAHTPVLLPEMLSALAPAAGDIYVDGTFGAGGYSRAILRAADCRVFAIDRDPDARAFAQKLEQEFPGRFVFLVGNFSDMCALLQAQGVEAVQGIVLDIGVSSMQIDQAGRGFSFRNDGPLDMRMSQEGVSAADIINGYSEEDIADILYVYGEEYASRKIARAIVRAREQAPITRTTQLSGLVAGVIGKSKPTDPATKTFQALRIKVNDELGELERGLKAAESLLAPGGRLVVVTFHSLEDRIVKCFTHSRCGKSEGVSRHAPELVVSNIRDARTDVAAPLPAFFLPRPNKYRCGPHESRANPRARSATLRVAIRNDNRILI